jgi:serine/threonine protein kinase
MGDTITQIGRYEISRQLVDTALASVYDAFDPVERKPVAIRVPRTQQHATSELALGLRHPGLMKVLSYGESEGSTFLVLESFQGKPLDTLIQAGHPMEPAAAIELLRQLASVLDYAHAYGSIHGSLHPSGILLNDHNQIKVLDLGAGGTGREASAEQLLRAVPYLSPECLRDQPLDGRGDQFSLGVLALALLTGTQPFAGKPLGVMFRIAYLTLERDAIRELPAAAQKVFQRALAKRAADRYTSCSEMVEALASALLRTAAAPTRVADLSQFAPVAAAAARPAAPERSWKRHFSGEAAKYFGITFFLIGLLMGALLYFLLPRSPKPEAVAPVAAPAPAKTPAPVSVPGIKPPATQPQPSKSEAKAAAKPHAKKKTEPEVDLKPVEPKIIRN